MLLQLRLPLRRLLLWLALRVLRLLLLPTPSDPAVPRRLNDRKVPDFWEDRPEFWFRIFDAHLSHFAPSEQRCFDALLPLLTPAARATVHSVIRTPGSAPYSRARFALIRHFGQTPHQMARTFRETRVLGDMLPSELLDHLLGLIPDVNALVEVVLLDALPSNARDAALQQTGMHAMAAAADSVALGNRALETAERSVNALSLSASPSSPPMTPPDFSSPAVHAVQAASATPRSSGSKPRKSDSLCSSHARWGKETYKCLAPHSCRMRGTLKPRPPAPSASPAPGNGPAGGRQ